MTYEWESQPYAPELLEDHEDLSDGGPLPLADMYGIKRVFEVVKTITGCPRRKLVARDRSQRVAGARQIAYYLARKTTDLSFPDIGRVFHRDHSTVVHGCNLIMRQMVARPTFAAIIRRAERELSHEQRRTA